MASFNSGGFPGYRAGPLGGVNATIPPWEVDLGPIGYPGQTGTIPGTQVQIPGGNLQTPAVPAVGQHSFQTTMAPGPTGFAPGTDFSAPAGGGGGGGLSGLSGLVPGWLRDGLGWGDIGSLLSGAGRWALANPDIVLGGLGAYAGYQADKRANEAQDRALRLLEDDYAARRPVRDQGLAGLLGPGTRPDLRGLTVDSSNPYASQYGGIRP